MSLGFEELDWRPTPIGTLSLRRRKSPSSGEDIFEIKLGDEFLMSSLFTVAEIALAELGLAAATGAELDVVVGGLGLGYTAEAVLQDRRVGSLTVVEALPAVIEWHRTGLLPLGERLSADNRCRFVEGDFFGFSRAERGFDPADPDRRFHAILLDIDHSPRQVLAPGNAAFYTPDGLRKLTARLHPTGVFALWSNEPPDEDFQTSLSEVFRRSEAHVVSFFNPHQDRQSTNTVYVAIV